MIGFLSNASFFAVFACMGLYFAGMAIQRRFPHPLLNPMLLSMTVIVVFLVASGMDYRVFQEGAQPLSFLLTPATVALAIPLYQQLDKLKQNWQAIIAGISAGVVASGTSIFLMCALLGMNHAEYVSILPKSITTAIGMVLSEELGGYPSITVGMIIVAGLSGNIFGEQMLRLMRIDDPIARGIGMGSASHAFGTTRAITMGEVEGAMSGLSTAVSGLITVVAVQAFVSLL